MGCGCNQRRIDPTTGRRMIMSDGNEGKGWNLVLDDGSTVHFSSKHAAQVERIRLGGTGQLQPAT